MGEVKDMICTHNDCFTCPYDDCISNVEVDPVRKKKGRKPISAEEKARRRKIYNQRWYEKNKATCHARYIEKSEGKVKTRYNKI